jgi:hypothetical protein
VQIDQSRISGGRSSLYQVGREVHGAARRRRTNWLAARYAAGHDDQITLLGKTCRKVDLLEGW